MNNTGVFLNWQKKIIEMSEKKVYFPELQNSLQKEKGNELRTTQEETAQQLQETFFPDSETIFPET